MTTGHYLRSMRLLTDQWTPSNFRDEHRQRMYLKDIDCPPEWAAHLKTVIPPSLWYLNENSTTNRDTAIEDDADDIMFGGATTAVAGDLMSSLPDEMRAQNLMCYIGHEGTYTPAHREMCASLGQNLMVEASVDAAEEKAGSSIWFMTESKDRAVVKEYFLSMLGHDIEVENHFAQINAWKKASFPVYIVEQKVGDFILVPPLAAHQVWNRGTRTVKVAWNRTTVETLEMALHEALPKARLVCRDEQYKNKAIIYYTLDKYYKRLIQFEASLDDSMIDLGQRELIHAPPRIQQLAQDFRRLFALYTEILVDEMFSSKVKDVELLEFDSNITCSYCRCNIFNRFLTCKNCVRTLNDGVEDTYDVCMECYAMGRSCYCVSGLRWCEQWEWRHLVEMYEIWRTMVVKNDGFIDIELSPQPLEIARLKSRKKSVAQICQEELRRRPFKDITQPKPAREKTPDDVSDREGRKKRPSRKKKKGDVRRCHVCCHKDFSYKIHTCTNPDCDEGYCYGVLYRAFDQLPQQVQEDEGWQCPKCLGICNCGACRRFGNALRPYTPKNTLLGHDTRRVADDRSIDLIVDFRGHNLSWLKAAGEESRSQNSRRMQALKEQADHDKAQEPAPQDATQESIEHGLHRLQQALNDYQDQLLPPYADGGGVGGVREIENEAIDPDTGLSFMPYLDANQPQIGMGYYEQDDTPDKILFDPFQAPSADILWPADEPEFVAARQGPGRKGIKRRVRNPEDDDPDYGTWSKKRRNDSDDILDNMDPALFDAFTENTTTVCDQADDGAVTQANGRSTEEAAETRSPMADGTPALEINHKKKPPPSQRYPANEPVLRHARPTMSYVEEDEPFVDDPDDFYLVTGPSKPPPVPTFDAEGTLRTDVEKQKRARIKRKRVSEMVLSAEDVEDLGEDGNGETMDLDASFTAINLPRLRTRTTISFADMGGAEEESEPRRRRGRPPKSASAAADDKGNNDTVTPRCGRGRPPKNLGDSGRGSHRGKGRALDGRRSDSVQTPTQPRRRGRPSRTSMAAAADASSSSNDSDADEEFDVESNDVSARKTARRVVAASTPAPSTAVPGKRPRGRPRTVVVPAAPTQETDPQETELQEAEKKRLKKLTEMIEQKATASDSDASDSDKGEQKANPDQPAADAKAPPATPPKAVQRVGDFRGTLLSLAERLEIPFRGPEFDSFGWMIAV